MREIKFRAWVRKYSDEPWEMVEWHPEFFSDTSVVTHWGDEFPEPDDEDCILMQSTGLKDKNGKEIYEGDILSFAGNITADDSLGADPNGFIYDETSKYAVMWDEKEGAWFPDTTNALENEHWKYRRDTRLLMRDGRCEVVGNIYENPELLKK